MSHLCPCLNPPPSRYGSAKASVARPVAPPAERLLVSQAPVLLEVLGWQGPWLVVSPQQGKQTVQTKVVKHGETTSASKRSFVICLYRNDSTIRFENHLDEFGKAIQYTSDSPHRRGTILTGDLLWEIWDARALNQVTILKHSGFSLLFMNSGTDLLNPLFSQYSFFMFVHEFWGQNGADTLFSYVFFYDFCILLPCEDSGKVLLVLQKSTAQDWFSNLEVLTVPYTDFQGALTCLRQQPWRGC